MASTDHPTEPGTTAEEQAPDAVKAEGAEEEEELDGARARSLSLGGGVGGGIPLGKTLGGYVGFLGEVRDELRKVTWPTRRMVMVETVVVIIFVVFFTLLITSLDAGFSQLFNWLLFRR